jgi:hypothetical protein
MEFAGGTRLLSRIDMARLPRIACLLCVLFVPAAVAAEETASVDLSGTYACEGQNPDGSAYVAVVEIVRRGDTYLVRWTMPQDVQVTGVGIRSGGVLAVSYVGGGPAIVVYSVGEDGRLDGTWTLAGAQGAVFSETLTRVGDVLVRPERPAAPRETPRKRRQPAPGLSL